jgi:antitoxin (DNA-binding transcriptional repressor) of toxin-antitoxin stability system
MHTDIRHLKSNLTYFVHKVSEGETVIIEAEGQAVAWLVAPAQSRSISDLRCAAGISWDGQKPQGLAAPDALLDHSSLSERVVGDRN